MINFRNDEEEEVEIPEEDEDASLDDDLLAEVSETEEDLGEDELAGFGHISETAEESDEEEEDDEEEETSADEELEDDAEDVDFDTFDDIDEM